MFVSLDFDSSFSSKIFQFSLPEEPVPLVEQTTDKSEWKKTVSSKKTGKFW